MYKLSAYEKESIILFNQGDEYGRYEGYSNYWKKQIKNGLEWYPDKVKLLNETEDGRITATAPAKWLERGHIPKPPSEAQKRAYKAAAENLRKCRQENK